MKGIMLISSLILTGCVNDVNIPLMSPVKPKLNTYEKCGKIKYEKKNGNVILDYKVARCTLRNTIKLSEDKKVLLKANAANVKQMKRVNKFIKKYR